MVYLEKHFYWDFTPYKESDLSGEGYLPEENGHYFHLARKARDNGWRNLVPITPGTKACHVRNWDRWGRVEPTDEEIRGWIQGDPLIGFGFAHNSSLIVIDLDLEDKVGVDRRLDWLARNIPGTPAIRV